ncbi:uncharacterized protein EV422DRAFT_514818 [Fimicolochytrium jonesii]|uniref:uncharacterized protein n=1 Tax=Fimicolochytrium jonesii TaxID=1396493 RepID=UPI0022FE8EAA|nr:uncharacterized protein EV422DRAFT_514818 [Fimicolochytrium jonesii]KAI8825957.1 hypothetical protein EV422DRAFT_514818 [Fimicolochytrium jonesii]
MTPKSRTPRAGSLTPRPHRITAIPLYPSADAEPGEAGPSKPLFSFALPEPSAFESPVPPKCRMTLLAQAVANNTKAAMATAAAAPLRDAMDMTDGAANVDLVAPAAEPLAADRAGNTDAPSGAHDDRNEQIDMEGEDESKRQAERDPQYEFNAPQFFDFHDFKDNASETGADTWFDSRTLSPTSTMHFGDGDRDDFDDDEDEEYFAVHDVATPKASQLNAYFRMPSARKESHVPQVPSELRPVSESADEPAPSGKTDPNPIPFKAKAKKPQSTFEMNLAKAKAKARASMTTTNTSLANVSAAAGPQRAPRPSVPTSFRAQARAHSISGHGPEKNALAQQKGPRPLTIPKEFTFVARLKAKQSTLGMRSPGGIQKKKTSKINGLTIPRPFRLHTTNFRSTLQSMGNDLTNAPKSPFVPLAVRIKTFENQVPDRFRPTGPKGKKEEKKRSVSHSGPISPWRGRMRTTRPQSPFLLTKLRTKSHTVPSREEQELAELAKFQPFKAKPADPHILHADRPLGVPTVPRPLPTVPESPAISKPRAPQPRPPSPPRIIAARPVPKTIYEKPFEPQIQHRVIEPSSFELPGDEISRRKKMEFEARQREEEMRMRETKEFRAQPLPVDDIPMRGAAYVPPKPPTEPAPFNLETEFRGAFARMTLEERQEKQREEEAKRRQFKAQPLPFSIDHPFFPQPSNKPLTNVEDVVLSTEERAEERKAFDEERRIREAAEEEMRRRAAKEQEEREKLEIAQDRAQRVHKAQPPQYDRIKPLLIKPSDRKLTDPHSPFIGAKRKKASADIKVERDPAVLGAADNEFDGEYYTYHGGGGSLLQQRLYEVAERLERGESVSEDEGDDADDERT